MLPILRLGFQSIKNDRKDWLIWGLKSMGWCLISEGLNIHNSQWLQELRIFKPLSGEAINLDRGSGLNFKLLGFLRKNASRRDVAQEDITPGARGSGLPCWICQCPVGNIMCLCLGFHNSKTEMLTLFCIWRWSLCTLKLMDKKSYLRGRWALFNDLEEELSPKCL